MILDGLLSFNTVGTPQAITVTAPSDNVLDMKNGRDMGIGDNPALKLAIYVTESLLGNAGTLQIQVQAAPDNGSGSPGAYVTLAESRAYAIADLTKGAKLFPIDLPHRDPSQLASFPRFYRLNYVVGAGPFTSGSVDAKLVLDRQDSAQYPAGQTVQN